MKELQYKDFSLKTHQRNWQSGSVNLCQFELTFKCDFHCKYCYSDCYNKKELIKKELSTEQVKSTLDRLYLLGVIWLCFTGGDPLAREDFFEIYDYAKKLGFIITIFTTSYSINEEIVKRLQKKPPFVIEITLNSIRKDTFEEISGLKDSFSKSMQGLRLLIKNKMPLKIKTILINDNVKEIWQIRRFVESLNLKFFPDFYIRARLNNEQFPCSLRLSPREALLINKQVDPQLSFFKECSRSDGKANQEDSPFYCSAGCGSSLTLTPYGQILFCPFLRNECSDILTSPIEEALIVFRDMRQRGYVTDSKCRFCQLKKHCFTCPGDAYLETGDLEAPIKWWCEMASLVSDDYSKTKDC
ncbi:MAG: radical SAM protein [Candidatus Omnitrophota bacterium]